MNAITSLAVLLSLTTPQNPQNGADALGLQDGNLKFETPDFHFELVKDSQTVAALKPKNAGGFDFTPSDRIRSRASNGYFQLGDITLRLRTDPQGSWESCSSAEDRKPVLALNPSAGELAKSDLSPSLPQNCPLKVTRTWSIQGRRLSLVFQLANPGAKPVQIGALGIPLDFNNNITNRDLPEANRVCSFSDPYIGMSGGYVQVTRLSGGGPALVVVPAGHTDFEAYRRLNEPRPVSQTFEGTFEWMVHTKAFAENEWKGVKEWNAPTMVTVQPGRSVIYGLKFLVSDTIRDIEKTLAANGRPVAVGIPGYILPMDQNAKLFLRYGKPVKDFSVDPPGALRLDPEEPTKTGWQAFTVHGRLWGRARLTLTYADGLRQSVSYYVTKPETQAVDDLGHFLTTRQWFTDPNDPFHRAPAAITYDREANKQVTQDSRVWIAGLGDEAGSGSWLATAMKEFGRPNPTEIAKYEQFVDKVLWGGIQYKDGPNKYGVRKSIFYYDPKALPNYPYNKAFNWTSWTSWNKGASEDIGRGYNYPHVVAAYWAMYRLARNHVGLVKNHPWSWYLDQAYQTTMLLTSTDAHGDPRVGYVDMGLMEGDVFLALLQDLQREGWSQKANDLIARMKRRVDRWVRLEYPFGSEMAWDSTGQEEVYAWCRYFGREDKALVALNSIIGYMPTVPHWGYNGNARRYWDFIYGGKLRRIERQLHHYGSGLNAIPVLAHYREHPNDLYLLRIGYGGEMGSISNIDQEGFASVAMHSYPQTLKWDAYSGDYGPNFFGHAFNTATYLIDDVNFGWQAFGGNVTTSGHWVKVEPKDAFRMRFYVAPRGLWLTLDAGTFSAVEVNDKTGAVRLSLSPATREVPKALLHIEQPAKLAGVGAYRPKGKKYESQRGGFTIPLKAGLTKVDLVSR